MAGRSDRQKGSLLFCLLAMFLFAASVSMVGIVIPAVIKDYQVSLSEAGIITVAQNAGGLIALSCCGPLADRYGKRRVILILFFMMTAALLSCFFTDSFASFVIAAMILGLCASSLNMCISAYLSDLYPEKNQFYVNLAGVLFGLGSVAGPVYVSLAGAYTGSWKELFGILGILCLAAPMVLIAGRSGKSVKLQEGRKTAGHGAPPDQQEKGGGSVLQVFSDRRIWIFAATGFFYMAHSSAYMAWVPTWLELEGTGSAEGKNLLMTVYWVSILAGRILTTMLSERIRYRSYMLLANGLGFLGMICMISARGPILLCVIVLTGIATASVFQVCLARTCSCFARCSGSAGSVVAFSASAGGTLSCLITGIVVEKMGFANALAFLGIVLICAAGMALIGENGGETS